jgi:hypothetical protein
MVLPEVFLEGKKSHYLEIKYNHTQPKKALTKNLSRFSREFLWKTLRFFLFRLSASLWECLPGEEVWSPSSSPLLFLFPSSFFPCFSLVSFSFLPSLSHHSADSCPPPFFRSQPPLTAPHRCPLPQMSWVFQI